MKKTLCVIIALIIAVSSLVVVAYAETPIIKMTVDNTSDVKVGDTVTVTVRVEKDSKITATELYVVYDKGFFEVVSMEGIERDMHSMVYPNFAAGKAKYVGICEKNNGFEKGATLFTAQLKVLKRGGTIALEANEVMYYEYSGFLNLTKKETDGTDAVNQALKGQAVTIVCPHAEKTTTKVTDATCAAEGKMAETCNECGFKKETAIPKLAHTGNEIVIAKAATCKEIGEQGKKCTVCGQVYDRTSIDKAPHDLKKEVTKIPTCAEEGKMVQKCTVCGYTTGEEKLPTIDHEMKEVVLAEATCTQAGRKAEKCENCDYTANEKEIPALGHDMKEEVLEAATCGKAGKKIEKCARCSFKSEEKVIPALEHNMKEEVLEAATCGKAGKKVEKCANCGLKGKESEIPALVHEVKEVVVTEATCEANGKKVEKCENCGYTGKETVILAKGHEDGAWEVVKNPTATTAGREEKKCKACGKVIDSKEIPANYKYTLGDVNNDKSITAVDARTILRSVAGSVELTATQKLAADVNKDGAVTAVDARLILQYVVGIVKF